MSIGKSGIIKPSIPISLHFLQKSSTPNWKIGLKYPMIIKGILIWFLISLSCSNKIFVDIPLSNAIFELICIVSPSAKGSLNGKPISIISTPAETKFLIISIVLFNSGNPAVKYIDKILSFSLRVLLILFIIY